MNTSNKKDDTLFSPFNIRRVLIIDDDIDFAESISDILILNNYKCLIAQTSEEIAALVQSFNPQVALIDIRLGQENGINLISLIKERRPNVLCIMITAYAHIETAVQSLQHGAYDYLRKPISGDELIATLDRSFEKLKLEYEKEQTKQTLQIRNKELEESNSRLRMFINSTRKITTCTRLPEFGSLLLKEFAHNMAATGGSFFIKKNDAFILLHSLDPGHAPKKLSIPLKKGSVFAHVISTKKPLLIKNINEKNKYKKSGWEGYNDPSFLVFPLSDISGDIFGLISFHNKTSPPFTSQDLDFGMVISTYTSESLHAVNAKENLIRSEDKYRSLVETMNDGLIVIDQNEIITYTNNKFCEMLGYSQSELIDHSVMEFRDDKTNVSFLRHMGATSHLRDSFEIIWKKKDGNSITTLVAPQAISEIGDTLPCCFAVITDITERKDSEEALRQQKHKGDIRVKELNCLFAISSICTKPNISLDEIFQKTIHVVPRALQYPEIACTKISINKHEYCTEHCKINGRCPDPCPLMTPWLLTRKIIAYRKEVGSITVWYKGEKPECDEGPFLTEEKSLINAVADLLGSIIERNRAENEIKNSLGKLQRAMEGIIHAMAMTAEMRDPYTAGHQRRVSKLASEIAIGMGLSNQEIEGIRLAGTIHDIGKIYVPAEILSKPGIISDIEFSIIKTHPQVGHDILEKIEFPWPLAKIVHQHHERLNGTGYPLGLTGNHISLPARILCVADVVEAMASHRPYRPSLGIEKALEEINTNAGTLYDPEVVKVCTDLFIKKGFEFE